MKSFFSFDGRITRSRFWLNSIISILLLLAPICLSFSFLGVLVATASATGGTGVKILWLFVKLFSVIVCIAGMVVSYSAVVRRFHDRDKSGWWSLISFVPFIGGLWILVDCGCLKGTDGQNQYGDDPIASSRQGGDSSAPTTTSNSAEVIVQSPSTT